jgi:hypothetical protein
LVLMYAYIKHFGLQTLVPFFNMGVTVLGTQIVTRKYLVTYQ